jgi:multidrug efflux system membrane fusion protein
MPPTASLWPFLKDKFKHVVQAVWTSPLLKRFKAFSRTQWGLVGIALFLMLWGLKSFDFYHAKQQKVLEASYRIPKVGVITSIAQEKTTYLTVQGVLEAKRKALLKAETSGMITEIKNDKGRFLKKNEEIITIAVESKLAERRQAEALVDQRKLEYNNAQQLQSHAFRSKTAVADSKSKLEAAEAALEIVLQNIKDTVIRAPFDGMVDNRMVAVGDYVDKGNAIVSFVDDSLLLATANIPEAYVNRVHPEEEIVVMVDGQPVKGKITFISKIADPQTRTYRVDADLRDAPGGLRHGHTAKLQLSLGRSRVHVVAPSALTLNDQGEVGVKIVDTTQKARFHGIDILHYSDAGVRLAGLPDKASIIVRGQDFVNDGDTVLPLSIPNQEGLHGQPH